MTWWDVLDYSGAAEARHSFPACWKLELCLHSWQEVGHVEMDTGPEGKNKINQPFF